MIGLIWHTPSSTIYYLMFNLRLKYRLHGDVGVSTFNVQHAIANWYPSAVVEPVPVIQ
jgi:hypothetical protein